MTKEEQEIFKLILTDNKANIELAKALIGSQTIDICNILTSLCVYWSNYIYQFILPYSDIVEMFCKKEPVTAKLIHYASFNLAIPNEAYQKIDSRVSLEPLGFRINSLLDFDLLVLVGSRDISKEYIQGKVKRFLSNKQQNCKDFFSEYYTITI